MNQRVQVSGVCIISQRVCTYVLRDQDVAIYIYQGYLYPKPNKQAINHMI
jgi:hypothetical protein